MTDQNGIEVANPRVEIAKDVLALIQRNAFEVAQGEFVDFEIPDRHPSMWGGTQGTVADFNNNLVTRCEVCGVGAMFVAYMLKQPSMFNRRLGKVKWPGIQQVLGPIFGDDLRLIEIAFERGHGCWTVFNVDDDTSEAAAANFSGEDENPEDRLVRIMENVIENNGRFVP